jgi:RNA polymerase sigma-70 factor (ECF subfamily)
MAEPSERASLDSTAHLLSRVREGDVSARDRLFARVLPALRRCAHNRLPAWARDLHDTEDLVQITVTRALRRLDAFEPRGPGAFLAYLRQILLNAVRNELRRVSRRPAHQDLDETLVNAEPSALEVVVGRDAVQRYERSLASLDPEQREAVILRIELGLSHQEIAELQGRASADAARMVIARALVRVAEGMRDDS